MAHIPLSSMDVYWKLNGKRLLTFGIIALLTLASFRVVAVRPATASTDKPWWFLPTNWHYEAGTGSSREMIVCDDPFDSLVPPPVVIDTAGIITFDMSASAPDANGVSTLTVTNMVAENFYVRTLSFMIFTTYLWGEIFQLQAGNGSLDTVGGNLNVDAFTNIIGDSGTYTIQNVFTNNVTGPSRVGDMLISIPVRLHFWSAMAPYEPPDGLIDIIIDFTLYITTGFTRTVIDDPTPYPSASLSMDGYQMSATGVPCDPYTGIFTGVSTYGGLDIYSLLFIGGIFIDLYIDYIFKEIMVCTPKPPIPVPLTDVTVLASYMGSAYTNSSGYPASGGPGELVNITVTIYNGLDYTATFNITFYADEAVIEPDPEPPIIIAIIPPVTVPPKSTINITVTWNVTGVPPQIYTIKAELYGKVVIDSTTYTFHDAYTDGTVLVTFPGDMVGPTTPPRTPPDGVVGFIDLGEFADSYTYSKGQPKYNPRADLMGAAPPQPPEGYVGFLDLGVFADNYGNKI